MHGLDAAAGPAGAILKYVLGCMHLWHVTRHLLTPHTTYRQNPRTTSQGGSSPEFYGFAIYLASHVLFALYLAWALLPDDSIHALGITYFPNKWWALVLPIWGMMLIPWILSVFVGCNLWATPKLGSSGSVTGGCLVVLAW
jgi:hypothetical protein